MGDKLTVKSVLDKVAEELGLNPDVPGNDPEMASEWNVRREKMLAEFGSEDAVVESEPDEVRKLADIIREDAEQVRLRRDEGKRNAGDGTAVDDPNPTRQKTQAQMESGAKALPDIVKRMAERTERYGIVSRTLLGIAAEDTLNDVIARPSIDDATLAVQRANDEMLFVGAMGGSRPGDERTNWKRWKTFGAFTQVIEAAGYKRAMETGTDASGGYWAPTVMSADLVEKVYEGCNLLPLIPRVDFPMGRATWELPTEGSDTEIYMSGEATADDGDEKFTASTPGTSKVTISAKQLTSRTVVSWEMEEDSIVPIAAHVRTKMIRAFTRGLEDAIINGDTTSTHIHADITAATDRRKAFNGFVDHAFVTATGANASCATYWNFEQILAPTLTMNQYAAQGETILLCNGPIKTKLGYLTDTNSNSIQLTYEDIGTLGFAATGRVLDFAGYPVVTSAKVRATVAATGYHSGTDSTYTTIYWVHMPSWRLAVKREMTLEGVRRAEQGQNVLVGHWRGGFRNICADQESTNYTCSANYGITSV